MAHEYEDEHGKPSKTCVYLEEGVLDALEEAARRLAIDAVRR